MFIGLPMIARFVPLGLPFTNSSTFHVNMTFVNTIGVCNKQNVFCLLQIYEVLLICTIATTYYNTMSWYYEEIKSSLA